MYNFHEQIKQAVRESSQSSPPLWAQKRLAPPSPPRLQTAT